MRPWMLFLCIATIALPGCGSEEIPSGLLEGDVSIDGKMTEWDGALTYLDEGSVAVGARNDGEFLYVALETRSRDVGFQVMSRGLTLWFDPDGGNGKTLGIRYPTGLAGGQRPKRVRDRSGDPGQRMAEMRERLEESLDTLEVLEYGEERGEPLSASGGMGIEARIDADREGLRYELKVPLRRDDERRFALDTDPGSLLGVRLETPKIDTAEMRKRMGGRRGGRGGGGMGGMGRGGPEGAGPRMPEPLRVELKLRLAEIP